MKHLVKKYLFKEVLKGSITDINKNNTYSLQSFSNEVEYDVIIRREDNQIITGQTFIHNGVHIPFPTPNPIVLYFDVARGYIKHLEKKKNEIAGSYSSGFQNINTETLLTYVYSYFGSATVCITFLFNSLEAFVNHSLKEGYVYRRANKEYSVKDIMSPKIRFEEKAGPIVSEIFGKDFKIERPDGWDTIINDLKIFRDEVVHTKPIGHNYQKYRKLISKMFGYDYYKSVLAVRDYINFYEPDLIEECSCGKFE